MQFFSFAVRAVCPRVGRRNGIAESEYGSRPVFCPRRYVASPPFRLSADVILRANDRLQVGLTGAFALTSAWVSSISDALHQPFCNQPGTARCALGRMPGAVA